MKLFSKLYHSFLYLFSKKELTSFLKRAHHLKTFEERSEWVQSVVRWVGWNKRPRKEFDNASLCTQAARLGFFIEVLERHPEDRKAVGIQLWALLSEATAQELFFETGLARERGFVTEFLSRLSHYILPGSVRENDLADLFTVCFGSLVTAEWIDKLEPKQIDYWCRLVRESAIDSENAFPGLTESLSEALIILGAHIASVGVSRHVLTRSPKQAAHESAFIKLNRTISDSAERLRNRGPIGPEDLAKLDAAVEACGQSVQWILKQVELEGVSVRLVFDVESLQTWIKRTQILIRLVGDKNEQPRLIRQFMADLARESVMKRSLRELVSENIHIISRKIVERTGVSGEHYITKSFSDYVKMLYQAMGGGILTAVTTIGKYLLTIQHYPMFFEGFFIGMNYSLSFIVIQLLHFTLATKQPSMTAPNLAGKLLTFQTNEAIEPFVEEVARINRSQWISVVGNLSAVVPMAFFLDKAWQMRYGHPVFTAEYAEHTLHTLDPVHSLTLPYAVCTGVILWAASLCAGWFENWVVYENIPRAIEGSRKLQWVVGRSGAKKVSAWFTRQSAGFGGNLSLGFLLSYTGVFSKFFGLNLEVRHVTLSAGTLALAASSLLTQGQFSASAFALPAVGVLLIGFCNVTTSFLLALFIAARAREVKRGVVRRLLGSVAVSFLKNPVQFFYPVKG